MSSWIITTALLGDMALKSTLVLGTAWLIALLLRRRSPAARHLVWTAAVAAVLAIPFLAAGLPELRVPVPASYLRGDTGLVFRTVVSSFVPGGSSVEPVAQTAGKNPATTGRGRNAPDAWLPVLWAAGVGLSLLQMGAAYFALWRVRRGARRFQDGGMAPRLAAQLRIQHDVPVLCAGAGRMPMTFGIHHPAILMPLEAEAWSEERLRVVLLHELAHVRRGDGASHLVARLVLAVHWWNPLAWIAWRELLKERERAADDTVLAAGARASEYAGHLLEVARSMRCVPATASASVAMARRPELEGRLLAILDSRRRSLAIRGSAVAVAAVLAVITVAPFAAMRAQEAAQAIPPDVDATIRAANAQQNYDLLDHAASAYAKQQKYEIAHTLLENALAIREQVSGPAGAAYAAGLVKLGELALQRKQHPEALKYYARAAALGDRPEVIPALMYLGLKAYGQKQDEAAQGFFERVVNIQPAGPQAGPALTWMASLLQRKGGASAEAEGLFQRALAVEDTRSTRAATTMELYAFFLQSENRAPEADVWKQKAADIRKSLYGPKARLVAEAVQSKVYRIGAGISAPALLYKVEPEYSEEARAAKYQGTCVLKVEIAPDGTARNIQVDRALGLGLDEKAIEAVTRWKFKPGMKDGEPVAVMATIEINFRLM